MALHTGYVSPQYHMVFDDKFKTVFHDGKTTDKLDQMCSTLLADSRDCYAENEFDEDGMLIYKPPPLDEVWLSEPECRNCRIQLEKQCDRAVRQEKELEVSEVKRCLENSREPPPDLVTFDGESDDDGSVSSAHDFDPGGDGRDYWEKEERGSPAPALPDVAAKSPIIHPSDSSSPTTTPASPGSASIPPLCSPEKASQEINSLPLGCSANGKS